MNKEIKTLDTIIKAYLRKRLIIRKKEIKFILLL